MCACVCVCVCVPVCVCVDLMDLFGFVDSFGFVIVHIYLFTFQQLSCDGVRYSLSRETRKAYQSAWFDHHMKQ